MSKLEQQLASCLSKRSDRSQLRKLTIIPFSNVDFSSNAYLSLSSIPSILSDYHTLLQTHPSLGSGGSRLLDGNSSFAQELEHSIAAFHSAPSGLLFNSGFDANVGIMSCLPQVGDVIVYDELVHASAHDGMKLSRAAMKIPFKHNCVYGEGGLDHVLAGLEEETSVFVLVEGVYSMDGDVAPLRDIVSCVKSRLAGNGYIIVDEAHSTGIYGKKGRGLVCELGLEKDIFARLHTFGKAMSSFGGKCVSAKNTVADVYSYRSMLVYHKTVSDQLRENTDIHHCIALFMSCKYQCIVSILARRFDRRQTYTFMESCDSCTQTSPVFDLDDYTSSC
ncbi:acetyltransferase [Fusarium sporotrichioides]|uniref:Acetyltransferase n=1 Tax=Fusarium sporotrichioides TaxID=5514 RepID=A0A395RLL0_FUSSP|nr:acetyltransferase [Fusarium sporotrichioides]